MDNKIREFFDEKRNVIKIYLIAITMISLVTRILMINYESWDFMHCILPWIEEIKSKGGLASLKYDIGNYNIIYMTFLTIISYIPLNKLYLVKIFSIIFDYLCAIFGMRIIGEIRKKDKNKELYQAIVYTVILFLPTVLMNSSLWGQCDSIYTAFTLISLYFLLKDRNILAFIFAGLAFSFKLQFVFILPLYIILYFQKKNLSLLHFLIIPIVNIITCLPAIIAGRDIKDCLLIYFSQTVDPNNGLNYRFPNIYKFIQLFFGEAQMTVSVFFTVVLFALLFLYIMYNKYKLSKKNIIGFGIISILLMTQFLPHMHDRYALTAEVLLIIYIALNNWKGIHFLIISQIAMISEYLSFLATFNQSYSYLFTLIYMASCFKFIRDIVYDIHEENNSKKINEIT